MIKAWSGRAVQEARRFMAGFLPTACARCQTTITLTDTWVIGHRLSRAAHPELTWEPSNWQHEHRRCSNASAQAAVQEKAAANALRAAGLPVFPGGPADGQPPARPVSLPGGPDGAVIVPDALAWSRDDLARFGWLKGLLSPPGDAAPPLAMTRPHPAAVGSYGEQACSWIESTQRITLRWWQRLAITRQLEHDEQGQLVWRVVVESAPRRAGKSVRLRGVALWRLEHGAELFGEPQLVVHTGKDVAIVREIQRAAWRWAEDVAGWTVTRANGKEALETPGADRWLARAMHSVYGYDVCLGMVDEGWGVAPAAVDEGMEPATLERPSPQLHLTSTAHRQATSLMRRRISGALSGADPDTLLLLWAAAPGADAGDPETWRAASPHWTDARGRMIASKYAAALAGEVDPEADDLDPMAGFEAQYLNRWNLRPVAAQPGSPVTDEDDWHGLAVELPTRAPDAVAVEGWAEQGVSVARAWRVDGRAVVSVADVVDVPAAAALVAGYRCRRRPLVGASLAGDPVWAGRATSTKGAVRTAVADLSGLLRDDALRHDGGECLSSQVLGLRTSPAADGPRVRSAGRADAVKAAVWAAHTARASVSRGPQRIILPTAV